MQINMNLGGKNNFLNMYSLNSQVSDQKQSIMKNNELQIQKDSLSISPFGKAKNIIESLLKQKQKIIENKNDFIGRTLEKGGDMESIKPQLEAFDEQIKNIDEQIARTISEQIKQQTDALKKTEYNQPQTGEKTSTERLNSIISLSSNLSQARVVSAVKTKMEGEARVLAREIKTDEARGGASIYDKERLNNLQKQSAKLTTQINEKLINVSEEIKNDNDKQAEPETPEPTML